VIKASLARMDRMVSMGNKANLDHQVLLVRQVQEESKDRQEYKAKQARTVRMA
jgi:hypothetical protein